MLPFLAGLAAAAPSPLSASSVAQDADGKHPADAAFDGLLTRGWGEGGMGHGEGSWLEIDLGAATAIESVSIWPGNLKDGARSFREYARPKTVRFMVDGQQVGEPVRLTDEIQRKDFPLSANGRKLRVAVDDAYEGGVFADMYIAEVAVNFTEGERARAVEKVNAWRQTPAAAKLLTKYDEDVLAAYTVHKENSDDQESLRFLMGAAGDGPGYLRDKVGDIVPAGYRAAAIVPDEKAMLAIRKLKDPNGIPGLEMAALRAVGREQKEILEIVEIFYAYQELSGGGRRNVSPWAERGWEVGALQGFGEPLPIEIDREGSAWVADTGNNRVQVFDTSGVSKRQLGAKPDVSNAWFGDGRRWYAAGSGAGTDSGQFTNPLDVEIIAGKTPDLDRFAVLDAAGRVQVFDHDGRAVIGWTVRVDHEVQPRVGGEAYLAWIQPKELLVVIMGPEAVVFNLKAEELLRWKVTDGTPNGVDALPDGRIFMVFGARIEAYNADGFNYGTMIDQKVLGQGFEDLDVTVDEEGKLWALTDKGVVYKFKKPGKLDWKMKVSEVELERPRFGVFQGNVLFTDRDRIVPVDAAQMHADEVQAEKDKADKRKAEGKK